MTETDPLGKFIAYDYDPNGNLESISKGTEGHSVQAESYTYDSKNRVYEKYVAGIKQFTNSYDKAGDKTGITLAGGQNYGYTYDDNHRLTSATEPGGFKLANEYSQATGNDNGMRKKLTETLSGTTQSTTFGYDGLRRLISVTGPKGGVSEFFYNEQGGVSRIKSGSNEILQDFDDAGKLTSQTAFYSSRLDLKYTYEANGQLKIYSESSITHTYGYDFAKRLISWNNGSTTVAYNYDKAGNLLNPHGLNLSFNQSNEIDGFLYDDAGNL